jgi:hypothetical protein
MQNHLSALTSLTSDVLLDADAADAEQPMDGVVCKIRDLRRPFGSERDLGPMLQHVSQRSAAGSKLCATTGI